MPSRRLLTIYLICLGLQWFSRYAGAPVTDFTLDDWPYLSLGRQCESYMEAWKLIPKDPDRPLLAGILAATFHGIDDHPARFAVLSTLYYSLLLLISIRLVFELTQHRRCAFLFGVFFSLIPNLLESFQWQTEVAYAPALMAYAASALCWVRYLQSRRVLGLAGSLLLFAFGLGTYEFGIGLPFAFLMLVPRREWRRIVPLAVLFLIPILFYILWRFTRGFGGATGVLFPPRELHLSWEGMYWNAKEILRWWVGDHMLNCFREGFNGFALMNIWRGFMFILANAVVATGLVVFNSRLDAHPTSPERVEPMKFSGGQIVLFAVAWIVVCHAISLPAWTPARLNFFPAMGVALLIALALKDWKMQKGCAFFWLVAWLCLTANQGTSLSWHESGMLHRRLYNHLQTQKSEWQSKELVLFDTRQLRQRVTPGLLDPPTVDPFRWPYYQNASLLRGFAPAAMLQLIHGADSAPQSILDVEHGARAEGNALIWHERFNATVVHRTPFDRVYVVDCFQVAARSP